LIQRENVSLPPPPSILPSPPPTLPPRRVMTDTQTVRTVNDLAWIPAKYPPPPPHSPPPLPCRPRPPPPSTPPPHQRYLPPALLEGRELENVIAKEVQSGRVTMGVWRGREVQSGVRGALLPGRELESVPPAREVQSGRVTMGGGGREEGYRGWRRGG
jgi:hypothetical protein